MSAASILARGATGQAAVGEEGRVARALGRAGLRLAGTSHAIRAGDGSNEGTVDLVFASRRHTFAIEVTGSQGVRKRRVGRDFWESRERCRSLSASLGLPVSNGVRRVCVDMEWAEGGWPRASAHGALLGRNHVEQLERMDEEGARRLFLEWNGL